jgi:glycosyltransferase involved in cell wall biosynthesis
MTTDPNRRIVLVSHSREVGGAEVYLENLTRYLALESESKWQTELICRRDAAVDSLAVTVKQWSSVARLDVVRPADVSQMLWDIRRAALVQLNLSHPTGKYPFGSAMMAIGSGRPLVVTHHLALKVGPPWRQLMSWLGRAARRHIAVSHHAARVLLLDYGYPRDRVDVIHNGVDPRQFHPASKDARARFRHQAGLTLTGKPWEDDVLIACTVARLSPQKGLFDLLEATTGLLRETDHLRIVIAGEGDLRRALAERIRSAGLDQRVFLVGAIPRPQVAEWLAASDLFVLPSHYEGGPATALMEAMASGCAVVATHVSGVNELVGDADLGRLVPARDIPALSDAVRELIADDQLRATLAQRAREKVLADFTIDACLRRTEAVLREASG